jgi:hypothetical protein
MARPITITPVANGFIVESGCLELVFEGVGTLGPELLRWVNDPTKVEVEYTERFRSTYQGNAEALNITGGIGIKMPTIGRSPR